MRYEVLGPVRLTDGGSEFRLGSGKAAVVLATLAIQAGTVVPTGKLFGELWDGSLPGRPSASVYVHISALRKFLRRPWNAASRITTRNPGYLLEPGSDQFDFVLFQEAMHRGKQHLDAGRPVAAGAAFRFALDLWRGAPLGGVRGGPMLAAWASLMEESRLECLELFAEAQLASGRHREMVTWLDSLVAKYPLREAFSQLLMIALYRSCRAADALGVYRRARDVLRNDFGLEPGRGLRDLRAAILTQQAC